MTHFRKLLPPAMYWNNGFRFLQRDCSNVERRRFNPPVHLNGALADTVWSVRSGLGPCLKPGKTVLPSMKSQAIPELTRISSKGQVVIPSRVRKRLGIEAGNVFAILTPRKGDMVVLRRVDSKALQADLRVLREVESAWREIEQGQARRATRGRFLEELETW